MENSFILREACSINGQFHCPPRSVKKLSQDKWTVLCCILAAILDLPFEAAGRVTLPAFYHRRVGLALHPLRERWRAAGAGFWRGLGEDSLSRRNNGHRRKMDEKIRGEFSRVSGFAEKFWVLTKTPQFRGEWRLAPRMCQCSNQIRG